MTDHTMLIFLFAIGAVQTALGVTRHAHRVYWQAKLNLAKKALAEDEACYRAKQEAAAADYLATGGQMAYPSAAQPQEGN
ncbi:MAG TPA: hypothetical protein VMR80_10545 [Candidatus Acidoferrum sp.]|nr:hypothetical protein [Candidatus Acidoferrum sp.]